MCHGCWQKYGAPTIVNDRVNDAVEKIKNVYDYSCVGGSLHVVLDDWNLKDDVLDFCAKEIEQAKPHEWDRPEEFEAQRNAERACCDLFKTLTVDERASALALCDGYFRVDALVGK